MASSRLFLAIPIPEHIRNEVAGLMESFRGIKGLRLVPVENYHITVHFFGKIDDRQIDKLIADILGRVREHRRFKMQTDKLALFPKRHPKMLWIDFVTSNQFTELAGTVQQMAKDHWQSKEEKEQTPHITCGRIKTHELTLPPIPVAKHYEISADYIGLWKSVSTRDGVKYEPLHRFQLK